MTSIVVTFDESATETVSDQPDIVKNYPDEDGLSVQELQELLEAIDEDDATVHTPVEHPEWEHGKPCPDCGGRSISVLSTEEDIYDSFDGTFQYVKRGDTTGGYTSALCPECMTVLFDAPAEQLWR